MPGEHKNKIPREERKKEQEEQCRRVSWAAIGLKPPLQLPEELAPPVEEELLRKFHRGELPEGPAGNVFVWICRFRTWAEAASRIAAEEGEKTRT